MRQQVEHLQVLTMHVARDYPGSSVVLQEVTEIYKWLDDHIDQATPHLAPLNMIPLFLNVETAEETAWKWCSARQLCFNAPDSPRLSGVRSWLAQWKNLLLAAGATEIVAPDRPDLNITSNDLVFSQMRQAFRDFKRLGQLIDIVIVSAEKEEIKAHRLVLAASCEHFATMVCSEFSEGAAQSSQQHTVVNMDAWSARSLRAVIGAHAHCFKHAIAHR
jgi:hypothetical protein